MGDEYVEGIFRKELPKDGEKIRMGDYCVIELPFKVKDADGHS